MRVGKKFFTGALSGFIIYLIVIVYIFKDQIDEAATEIAVLILTDKAMSSTVGILLLSIVCYQSYYSAKKHS